MLPYRSLFVLYISFASIFSTVVKSSVNECTTTKIVATIIVDQSGKGNFKTVQAAVDSVPESNNKWIRIYVKPGIYKEKVIIKQTKPCIILEGSKNQTSVIAWNDSVNITTAGTITVNANNIVARYMVFKNTYNHWLGNSNNVKAQAPAAVIYGDKCAFYACSFYSFQDTLFDRQNRHYYKACLIEGAVDFIFGYGQSLFRDCKISVIGNEIAQQQSSNAHIGFITAHGRNSPDDDTGFVFNRGKVYGNGQAYLGRAWGPYSRVIFHETNFSNIVYPLGWDYWTERTHRWDLTYVENNCSGPGSDTSKRVRWGNKNITDSQMKWFTSLSFIDKEGWIRKQQNLIRTNLTGSF